MAQLTKNEINRKISEIRGDDKTLMWSRYHKTCCGTKETTKDWHADANWPTLLRELLAGHNRVQLDGEINIWSYAFDTSLLPHPRPADLGEAFCLAWLKWKEEK